MRHVSDEAKANIRNRNAANRNQAKADQNPLFAQAGILEQVVKVEPVNWTAQRILYEDLGNSIERYVERWAWECERQRHYRDLIQRLIDLAGTEAAQAYLDAYNARWVSHKAMQQLEYRLDNLSLYLDSLRAETSKNGAKS